jgi:hypothetical protein
MFRKIIALLALSLAGVTAHATSVLPLYLDEIVDTATVAFQGTVVENRTEREAATNLVVTYTTFAVSDVLKGTVGVTHTIKQVGGTIPGDDSPAFKIMGVPKFTVGEEVVVFLAGVSKAGFSSPIGLSQGHFHVNRSGVATSVHNGRDFRDMTSNIPASQVRNSMVNRVQQTQAVSSTAGLDEFKQLVRERNGRAK